MIKNCLKKISVGKYFLLKIKNILILVLTILFMSTIAQFYVDNLSYGPYMKNNHWNLSETFLVTPFFDGRYSKDSGWWTYIKFRSFETPNLASQEVFDLKLHPKTETEKHYIRVKDTYCLKDGSDLKASVQTGSCICNTNSFSNFIGPNCDIPGSVWKVDPENRKGPKFEFRPHGRRIIMGLVVDHELELTEVRFHQLNDTVDVFVILESNISAGGDPKPLYFFNALRNGFLWQFQHKIMYVFLDHIPKAYIDDGWLADDFLRNYMSQSALKRLINLKDDDLFLNLDADEIPKKEVVLFLKYHNGFHNPVKLNLRWSIFKFYWKQQGMTTILVGCTIDYLKQVCDGNAIVLRKKNLLMRNYAAHFEAFKGSKSMDPFEIGMPDDSAGFHCSWCTTPEGLSVKLRSAIHQDFPRWGDDPEKLKLDYLAGLLKTGTWFDGTKPVSFVEFSKNQEFAPEFVMENQEKYIHLLKKEEK